MIDPRSSEESHGYSSECFSRDRHGNGLGRGNAVEAAVPARVVADTVTASHAGATCTALAEMTLASPAVPAVMPRLAKFSAQPLDGAADTFLRGLGADAEDRCHLLRGLVFKITEQHGIAVGFAQIRQGGIEVRSDFLPRGVGFGEFIHGGGLLFAVAAAHLGADGLRGDVPCRTVEPAGEHRVIHEFSGVFRQRHEHALRHIFGKVAVIHHPERGGMNEVNMPTDKLGEGRLGAAFGVSS